jgi:hypothetical protein
VQTLQFASPPLAAKRNGWVQDWALAFYHDARKRPLVLAFSSSFQLIFQGKTHATRCNVQAVRKNHSKTRASVINISTITNSNNHHRSLQTSKMQSIIVLLVLARAVLLTQHSGEVPRHGEYMLDTRHTVARRLIHCFFSSFIEAQESTLSNVL